MALSMTGVIALVHGIKQIGKAGLAASSTLIALAAGAALLVWFVRRRLRLRDLLPAAAPATSGLIHRFGIRAVTVGALATVALGALLLGLCLDSGYASVAGALVLLGAGGGAMFTASSVTLMAAVSPDKAGGAAAVDEMSFELGGALGIAVLGSFAAALFRGTVTTAEYGLPAHAAEQARESLAGALSAAERLPQDGARLAESAKEAFTGSFATTSLVSAGVMAAAAALAAVLIPRTFAPAHHEECRNAPTGRGGPPGNRRPEHPVGRCPDRRWSARAVSPPPS
ncbi:hypothetical protein [Streptomyces sp. UNOC14_S4]|uniref:hypothetical protein n=1 Tax=Streptomyces sp. UNOC14_S4 TaxID=2872340 RepID=UPI001E59AA50|nr:hypothetical protein [Streptomyces sp. UNOC14_S4]MCC3769748.1 hypothetical protein [Streptomyces sp. UNOC14_S4]